MDPELMEKARAGLQGWQDGDLTALDELLDPTVELLWWEPGEWDCHSRDDVLGLLAQRRRDGKAIEIRQFKSREEALTAASS